MIDKAEIDQKAEDLGVHTANVQRDYVFGWLLAGLFEPDNPLNRTLILKGGNAFRKAYLENARFSNDLDFSTQVDLDEVLLRESVTRACQFAQDRSGVQFLTDSNRFGTQELAAEDSKFYEVRVYFKSFYGEEDITIRVNLDIKEYDRIFLPIQTRALIHSYSDSALCRAQVRSMKLEELLASKLKALLQRVHSPDLFDFIYSIFFQKVLDIRRVEVVRTFLQKTIYEPTPQIARGLLLALPFQVFRALWEQYVVPPKQSSIGFDEAESSFRTVIGELFALLVPSFAAAGLGPLPSYFGSHYREVILEAGRLQRILRLMYDGVERLVEPYSLTFKRRRDGVAREYFYAWDLSGGRSGQTGIKSFVSEKTQAIDTTDRTFSPRVPIELAKTEVGFFSARRAPFVRRRGTRGADFPFQIAYTLQCPYCGKTFKRNKPETRLNDHKDQYGNRCYGRVGTIV